jgi:hypothetical protein
MVCKFSSGMSLGVEDSFNSALAISSCMFYSYSNNLQNWMQCHTLSDSGTSKVLMLFLALIQLLLYGLPGVRTFFCSKSNPHFMCWLTERANKTTFMSTVLMMICDDHCGLQEMHRAKFNCQLLALTTCNPVYLILTKGAWRTRSVSRRSLLLHGTCSYLCFCLGSVLPYTWPCIFYFGIMITFNKLLNLPIDS